MSDAAPRPRRRVSKTAAALLGLAAGLALGTLLRAAGAPWAFWLADALTLVGQLWVAALRMTVVPLMIALTLATILGTPRDGSVGALGLRTVAVFVALLVAGGVLATLGAAPVLAAFPVRPETVAAFHAQSAPVPAPAATKGDAAASGIAALLPANPFAAAAAGDVLPILVFTVVFALAAQRLPGESAEPLRRISRAFADAMLVLVGAILLVLPLGVFALCTGFAFRTGLGLTGVLAGYTALACAVMLAITILLYPASALLGNVSLARFARGAAPAQAVAIGTRSSLAALPALVEGGRRHLALPASATGFVLPLSVSALKLDRTVEAPVKLLFLAHVYGVSLSPAQIAIFLGTLLLLSFSTAGIPSVGTVRSIPAYLAAGIPLEGVIVLNAVAPLTDVFETLINVTADMSAAVIVTRGGREDAA
ncbi:MAG TPA: cation:dicarboxylase symporter family transporter [Thermoanaerobaculia bacterium]|nr:cation:dicarboxylase symporter family transporter [Thermoanaerobaculia bacterium]